MKLKPVYVISGIIIIGMLFGAIRFYPLSTYRLAGSCGGASYKRLSLITGGQTKLDEIKAADEKYVEDMKNFDNEQRRKGLPVIAHGCRVVQGYKMFVW